MDSPARWRCGQRQQRAARADILRRTTTHDHDTPRERQALRLYSDDPMDDGDAVLLLDERVCLELEGLANEWEDGDPALLVDLLPLRVLPAA